MGVHRIGVAILVTEIEGGEHRPLAAPIAMREREEGDGHPGPGAVAVVAAVAAERRQQVADQAVLGAIPVEEGDQHPWARPVFSSPPVHQRGGTR